MCIRDSQYRGNCSPKLIEDLIRFFKPHEICDYMCGSGTSRDAANAMKIKSHIYDLHSGFDIMNSDIEERPEFIFWHPPYWDIIKYSDIMYSASDVQKQYGYLSLTHLDGYKRQLQIMLSYAKYGEIKYGDEPLGDERIQTVFSLIHEIDSALLSHSGKKRLEIVNTILVRCWGYIEDFSEMCKQRQDEAATSGENTELVELLKNLSLIHISKKPKS